MRKKNDYNINDIARIIYIYASINQGTEIFWREAEEFLLIKSAQFKYDD